MKVLVCGGRDFANRAALFAYLNDIHLCTPITSLIHGAARGADSLAAERARSRNIPQQAFPADWNKHGKAAGPIRNQLMVDQAAPDFAIAFPGGRGTADMIGRCRARHIPVHQPLA